MSEPLAERLSRFTPDVSGLDRDALLFAAGRASAHPKLCWKTLATVLVTQLGIFVGLWCVPTFYEPRPPVISYTHPEPVDAPPLPPDPSELWLLSERWSMSEDKWSSSIAEEPMIASDPPLRVFDEPPAKYFN